MTAFSSVFIDTSIYIYYLEHNAVYYDKAADFFEECYQSGKIMVTSAITVEEYSIVPYRNNDVDLLRDFRNFLTDTQTKIVDINVSIADKAAEIRAKFGGFKAMDALQLGAAVTTGCQVFLTNDKQLKQFDELSCIMLDEL